MPMLTSDEKAVSPSIRLSNVWIVTKRKKDLSRFLYHTKDHLAYFSEKKNGWWGATPSTSNLGSSWLHWSEIADIQSIFTRSASVVASSKKSSINTNRKSTVHFPMSLRWTSYVGLKLSPQGDSKRKTFVFHLKSHFAWIVCYKVTLCKNCQQQSCKAFIGLTIPAKWLMGDVPFYVKIEQILTHPLAKCWFSIYFRS